LSTKKTLQGHLKDRVANNHPDQERYCIKKDFQGNILGWKVRCKYCKIGMESDVQV